MKANYTCNGWNFQPKENKVLERFGICLDIAYFAETEKLLLKVL